MRGAVSARTGRLCRVNGSAGASLSCCGLCAALPISPGRSLRSPRRVPGNPVPVPALSARRGRSSVLPVRPDGTGGSSRRRRPEGQAPLAGRSLGPHGTAVPGQRLCRCLSLLLRPLCRSADQSRAKPAEALDGCRAILSRSRCCRLGGADPRSCRSGQTARVGRAAEGAPKGKPRLRGAVSARTGRLCRVNGSAGASLLLRPLCRSCRSVQGEACEALDGCRALAVGPGAVGLGGADLRCRRGEPRGAAFGLAWRCRFGLRLLSFSF